ncbi:MAG: hypothetical protein WC082_00385 [Victivallales bacterium]
MKDKNLFVSIVHVPEIHHENGWENFLWLQNCARQYGAKATIGVKKELLSESFVVEQLLDYRKQGDEIALLLNIEQNEEGKSTIDNGFAAYKKAFGEYPASVLSSRQDAPLWKYIKEKYPEVTAGIGFAFEEGDHVYHGHQIFNREWMDFCEGTPWWPFWPSAQNKQCPGAPGNNIEIMNFPWLVRDMIMSFLGRDDFYSSEIGDLLRSKVIDEKDDSYLKRFFEAYAKQLKYNPYSFYLVLQESGWLSPGPKVFEEPHELYKVLYEKYFSEIFSQYPNLSYVTLSEYSDWHKKAFNMENPPTVCVWEDIIYDSGKQYVWYQDDKARLLFDADQGASILDLRPYIANIAKYRGSDSKDLWDGSYPFLIQSFHRCNSGHKCELRIGKELYRLAEQECRLENVLRTEESVEFIFEPILWKAPNAELSVQTHYKIDRRKDFRLEINRIIKGTLPQNETLRVKEHFTGCWGTDSHPVSLKGIMLSLKGGETDENIEYAYKARTNEMSGASSAEVIFPEYNFKLSLVPEEKCSCFIKEGDINHNFYELGCERELHGKLVNEAVKTIIFLQPGKL